MDDTDIVETAPHPGRPVGSLGKLLSSTSSLRLQHFAFISAVDEGLDLRASYERYLAAQAPCPDLRIVRTVDRSLRQAIVTRVVESGDAELRSLLATWLDAPKTPAAAPQPAEPEAATTQPDSFDVWFEAYCEETGAELDFFSQREWMELYEEYRAEFDAAPRPVSATAIAPAPGQSDQTRRMRALSSLRSALCVPASATDRCAEWLDARICASLAEVNVLTLSDLYGFINTHGNWYWRRIKGLGPTRAERLIRWLNDITPETRLSASVAVALPSPRSTFGIVPAERLLVPGQLRGQAGVFRTSVPNTLGATDDIEAMNTWLERYQGSPNTLAAYKQAVERYTLWCLHVAHKPISSINEADIHRYRDFLSNIPPEWRSSTPVPRSSDSWRPWRKQPSQATIRHHLTIIRTLYSDLQDAAYLSANPIAGAMSGMPRAPTRLNANRSLDETLVSFVRTQSDLLPENPSSRRWRFAFELLLDTGIRLSELVALRNCDVDRLIDGNSSVLLLRVLGKGNKTREVPVSEHVAELMRAHHQDTVTLGLFSADASAHPDAPLLRPLDRVGALNRRSVHDWLKRTLAAIARKSPDLSYRSQLLTASTHWLRHTFGRSAADADVDIRAIQVALGHASLNTTTAYTRPDLKFMARELGKRRKSNC